MNRTNLLLMGLLVSIAINLFFVGGIGFRMTNSDDFSARPMPPNVSWMVRDLSDARRAELEPILVQSADEMRPIRREMFDAQSRVNELMAAQVFDSATIELAFSELRAANLRYQELSHLHSVAMLNQLSAAEREIALQFINRRGPMDGRSRRRNGDGPPDGDFRFGPDGPGPNRPPFRPSVNSPQ